MQYFAQGSPETQIDQQRAGQLLDEMLSKLGKLDRVLLLPPDYTRAHSWAGELTVLLWERLKDRSEVAIMPALGTHFPMTESEMDAMFPGIPHDIFREHDWRNDLVQLGTVPSEFVSEITDGKLDFSIKCQVNKLLVEGKWDRIISIGQLVPHEVVGIANHNKNIFVGVGGQDIINKSHYIGAVCNMERIMGQAKSPVRDVFNYAEDNFAADLPITYLLTVRKKNDQGKLITCGLFAGDDKEAYLQGAKLCQQVNLDLLDAPLKKVVVYLDPDEFKSTWLGNKAVYRTRMVMADDGELIILAPAVREFGEDPEIDRLIRKYGYRGTPHTLKMAKENEHLGANLSAAAHLIHGSSEGRFKITYCTGVLTKEEIENAGFEYANLDEMTKKYDPAKLADGKNIMPDGEEVFYVSNPALGLWSCKERFK